MGSGVKPRCISLMKNDKPCLRNASCVVRGRTVGTNDINWSGFYCKRHALDVVTSHWHHVLHGNGIEIISLNRR